MSKLTVLALGALLVTACSCGAPAAQGPSPAAPEPAPAPEPPPVAEASYEVHEWGLVRGNMLDQVMLGGPRAEPVPMAMAKPVLYFHREGEGALQLEVEVAMRGGHVVEHWPLAVDRGEVGARLTWREVTLTEGNCAGSSYPTAAVMPCTLLTGPEACEAAELATVETDDGDCLSFRGAAYDHLFYRSQLDAAPTLPLSLSLHGTTLRVSAAAGTDQVPGTLVRVQRSTGRVSVGAAPAPGASVELAQPAASAASGAEALGASLLEAGLTQPEVDAFRRAWDAALFGTALAAGEAPAAGGTVATASPLGGILLPASDDAILYVLPQSTADAMSTLTFTPPARVVRRAIVAWIETSAGQPARP